MSTAVKDAVVTLLVADTALVGVLTANPADGTKPAIFPARRNTGSTVYPSLVYRVSTVTDDNRFREPLPRAPGASRTTVAMQDYFVDFSAFDNQPSSDNVEAVGDRLRALFHQVAFSVTGGRVFYSRCVSGTPDGFDNVDNVWVLVARYRMRVQWSAP